METTLLTPKGNTYLFKIYYGLEGEAHLYFDKLSNRHKAFFSPPEYCGSLTPKIQNDLLEHYNSAGLHVLLKDHPDILGLVVDASYALDCSHDITILEVICHELAMYITGSLEMNLEAYNREWENA